MSLRGEPLRVMHTECSLNWGGQEKRICEELHWLNQQGHLGILASPPESKISSCARQLGIPWVGAPMRNAMDVRGMLALRKALRDYRIQIINTHGSRDTWLAFPSFLTGMPVIRTRHLTDAVRRGYRHSFGYRHGCDVLVATAACIKDALVAQNGLAASKIEVIGEFVDLDFFKPAASERGGPFRAQFNIPDSHLLFTVVGMIRSEKGQKTFIEAALRLLKINPKIRFAIVGEGVGDRAYETRCKDRLYRAFGANADLRRTPIFMAGFLPEVREVLHATDVLVVPSHAEAQSRVIPEAFAMGKCVLATQVGGIPEVVQHGKTGWLVTPRDRKALAEAMLLLGQDENLRRRLASGVRTWAEQHFSIDHRMNQTLDLYRRVLAERSSAKGQSR